LCGRNIHLSHVTVSELVLEINNNVFFLFFDFIRLFRFFRLYSSFSFFSALFVFWTFVKISYEIQMLSSVEQSYALKYDFVGEISRNRISNSMPVFSLFLTSNSNLVNKFPNLTVNSLFLINIYWNIVWFVQIHICMDFIFKLYLCFLRDLL